MRKLNFCIHISFSENTHYKVTCLPGFLCSLVYLVHPVKIAPLRLFPTIHNYSFPEILFTKQVTQWIFNPSSRKSYRLNFIGIYLHPIFYRPFIQGVHILLQFFYFVFICDFSIYIVHSSAKSLILESMFFQISFM